MEHSWNIVQKKKPKGPRFLKTTKNKPKPPEIVKKDDDRKLKLEYVNRFSDLSID
jgi:hypothetical protein